MVGGEVEGCISTSMGLRKKEDIRIAKPVLKVFGEHSADCSTPKTEECGYEGAWLHESLFKERLAK